MPVGGLAFLLPPRSALFLAAVAAIAVLLHTIWQQLTGHVDINVYATAGFLGLVLFTIAASASVLATRMRESEDLVRQKDLDLANLADLSQYIVQHLRESLLVVDAADRIRLINESAAEILGDTQAVPGALLGEVSPRLLYSLSTWRQTGQDEDSPSSFVAADGARLIQPHFAPLGGAAPGPTLIFLEDTSLMAERVQQSKLAALGRLSASIAHEIRNPVGAMSHAGQLLAESPNLGPDDHRLTDIIRNNSERVSTIINNVLQLSRREATKPTRLSLGDWLDEFLPEFSQTMQVPIEQIGVHEERDDLEVRFDPSHLHQVVWNLCDNAIKYGEPRDGHQGRDQACPTEPELPALSGGRRPGVWNRARGGRSHLRAVFYGPQGRHRTWAVHRPRTMPAEPCRPALRAAQRRRQRVSDRIQRSAALGGITAKKRYFERSRCCSQAVRSSLSKFAANRFSSCNEDCSKRARSDARSCSSRDRSLPSATAISTYCSGVDATSSPRPRLPRILKPLRETPVRPCSEMTGTPTYSDSQVVVTPL